MAVAIGHGAQVAQGEQPMKIRLDKRAGKENISPQKKGSNGLKRKTDEEEKTPKKNGFASNKQDKNDEGLVVVGESSKKLGGIAEVSEGVNGETGREGRYVEEYHGFEGQFGGVGRGGFVGGRGSWPSGYAGVPVGNVGGRGADSVLRMDEDTSSGIVGGGNRAELAGGNSPGLVGGSMPRMMGGYMPRMVGGYMPRMVGGYRPAMVGGYRPRMVGSYRPGMVGVNIGTEEQYGFDEHLSGDGRGGWPGGYSYRGGYGVYGTGRGGGPVGYEGVSGGYQVGPVGYRGGHGGYGGGPGGYGGGPGDYYSYQHTVATHSSSLDTTLASTGLMLGNIAKGLMEGATPMITNIVAMHKVGKFEFNYFSINNLKF